MARSAKWYGWVPDLPDHRDRVFRAPLARIGPLPGASTCATCALPSGIRARLAAARRRRTPPRSNSIRGSSGSRTSSIPRASHAAVLHQRVLDTNLSDDFWTIKLVH
jgi:hypothetical protein